MNSSESAPNTRYKVGIFVALALALVSGLSIVVNDRPFWWRPCQEVVIRIEDATGLKSKSAVRSLGIDIGFLRQVELVDRQVQLRICVTAPVEILPETRAYIRGEGFLGDKFVDLKPVRQLGVESLTPGVPTGGGAAPTPGGVPQSRRSVRATDPIATWLDRALEVLSPISHAHAQSPKRSPEPRSVPVGAQSGDVQAMTERVDLLVREISELTRKINQGIDPVQLKQTLQQLNVTLNHASRTLAPEGGLNTTSQRALEKLEDAIEQFRDVATRVNRGEGSVGMLLNDPVYAEEIRTALKSFNGLLTRVNQFRFVIDLGGEQHPAYDSTRGWFRLGLWPRPNRYYLLGVTVDPRGQLNVSSTTTTANGVSTTVQTVRRNDNGLLLTGMIGQMFFGQRLEVAVGVLHGDATASGALHLGPSRKPEMLITRADVYGRNNNGGTQVRLSVQIDPFVSRTPFSSLYLRGGVEELRRVNGKQQWFFGAGLSFDDEDVKLLFALR